MSKPGRILYNWTNGGLDESLVLSDESQLGDAPYDVAIVGAGIVGTALAYKLSMYKLRVLLLEKNYDVGEATTKGSSAIIHTGFDAPPDTLEAEMVTQAALEWPDLAKRLKIPLEPCGGLVLAIDDEQEKKLDAVYEKGLKNGVKDIQRLDAEAVWKLEPNASRKVRGGILVPRESIADPFAATRAFAEVALLNGVDIVLGISVENIEDPDGETKTVATTCGKKFQTRRVVNVAGLGSENLTRNYGGEAFDTNPRRGQFLIFDKYSRSAVQRILLPIPTPKTKGVLVIPTIFGNLIAGPTAEDYPHDHPNMANTTSDQIQLMLEGASSLYPGLKEQPVISQYAGVRSNCSQGSYWIRTNDNHPGIITVAGVRSTGFTSSPALARHLIGLLQSDLGVELEKNPDAVEHLPEERWPGWYKKRYDDPEAVKKNPDNGQMVCYCEQISRGDILQHLDSPLKPRTLDAIKRRTRAQMGRCQGFDCMVNVARIVSEHCGIPLEKITKRGPGSEIATP